MFKGKIPNLACGVVNLDTSRGPGTHYTSYFNHPSNEYVYYFDTYGAVPPTNVAKWLKTSGKIIAYSNKQIQPIASVTCGWYSIYVLRRLSIGDSLNDILLSFSDNPDENEEMIQSIFGLK